MSYKADCIAKNKRVRTYTDFITRLLPKISNIPDKIKKFLETW